MNKEIKLLDVVIGKKYRCSNKCVVQVVDVFSEWKTKYVSLVEVESGKKHCYGYEAFRRCLLEEVKEER